MWLRKPILLIPLQSAAGVSSPVLPQQQQVEAELLEFASEQAQDNTSDLKTVLV